MPRGPDRTTISSQTNPATHSVSLPEVCVVVVRSDDCSAGDFFDCSSGRITIGREDGSDVLLTHDEASRRHARIERHADCWYLFDDSRNGTKCNGRRVPREWQLEDGDRIEIANTVLAFLCAGDSNTRRTLSDVCGAAYRDERMPFPLAVLRRLVASHSAPLERIRASFDAIDTALRFFSAGLLAVVCEDPEKAPDAMAALRATIDSKLPWERAAFALASLAPDTEPIAEAGVAIWSAEVQGDLLRDALSRSDRLREAIFRHELAPTAYASEEPFLRDLLSTLLLALEPLSEYRLITQERIASVDCISRIRYQLYEHRGACELFPIVPAWIGGLLLKDWCYLRRGDTEDAPIYPLCPFVRYGACSRCGRLELGLAENVPYGTGGAVVCLRSVTSDHVSDIPLSDLPPDDKKRLERLYRQIGPHSSSPPPLPKLSSRPPPDFPVPVWTMGGGERPTPPPQNEPRILFLGASPEGMTDVRPDDEERGIRQALDHGFRLTKREIILIPKLSVRARDLQCSLNETAADVLHVSAHGSVDGALYLKDDRGQAIRVEAPELAAAVKGLSPPLRCVVLCACFSALAAKELAPHVGCIIGMKREIGAESAASFSSELYKALASGDNVKRAFERGCNQLGILAERPDPDTSALVLIDGTANPASIYLVRRGAKTLSR